jgi:hypothetical protein
MRKFSAYIYERRTRDKNGAAHIRAVRAPGTGTDVAPTWLIDSATMHSKHEYAREQRGGPPASQSKPQGKGSGKGKGKGKKKAPAAAGKTDGD